MLGLFLFVIISQSGSTVPLRYLQEVQGYRPLQSNLITLEIAALQLVMLPAMALLLDYKQVDSRVVSVVGLGLILASCIGSSFLTVYWNRDQFYLWQLLQAIGQPMVIMPLLMKATNTVTGPADGPSRVCAVEYIPRHRRGSERMVPGADRSLAQRAAFRPHRR